MRALQVVVFLVACGGNNSVDYSACVADGSASQQCVDCTTSSCSSQVSAFEGACPTFLACECPNGEPLGSNAMNTCSSDLVGTCLDAALTLDSCEHSTCAAQCGSGG
ncbi:MAG TPA: hypothetical protein VH143_06025 [Kofleriaceae bacterium]|jgi:hypothetical protein|nr:hypothetical protein [Kofleriaceae bacterium]